MEKKIIVNNEELTFNYETVRDFCGSMWDYMASNAGDPMAYNLVFGLWIYPTVIRNVARLVSGDIISARRYLEDTVIEKAAEHKDIFENWLASGGIVTAGEIERLHKALYLNQFNAVLVDELNRLRSTDRYMALKEYFNPENSSTVRELMYKFYKIAED